MKNHTPTIKSKKEVSALKSFGVSEEEIAADLGISHEELQEAYENELNAAPSKTNAEVGRFLFSLATGRALKEGASYSDCAKVAIFWAKARMNWREGKDFDLLSGGRRLAYPTEIRLVGESVGEKGELLEEETSDDESRN